MVLLTALALGGASASSPGAGRFVTVDPAVYVAALPAPPADDSLAGRADLETVLAVQARRTVADVADARADAKLGPMEWAAGVLGADFTQGRYPAVAGLLAQVRADMDALAHRPDYPQRPRPAQRDPRVQPVVTYRASAYPSACTASTMVWAAVLGDVFPQHRAALEAHAQRSAWLRVVGGAHYPTDLTGGRVIAERFLAELRASARYRRALARVRAQTPTTPAIARPPSASQCRDRTACKGDRAAAPAAPACDARFPMTCRSDTLSNRRDPT